MAAGTVVGAALGTLVFWASGQFVSTTSVLINVAPAAVLGTLAGAAIWGRERQRAATARNEQDLAAALPAAPRNSVATVPERPVLNRRSFFERASDLSSVNTGEHSVAVIDVNRPNVLSEDSGEILEDPTSDAFGRMVMAALDADAIVGRLATTGFGLVLLDTTPDGARSVCEAIRRLQPHGMETITPSIGLTNWHAGSESIDQALGRAEAALYRAKQRGGQRIEVIRRDDDGASLTSDLAPVSRR